MTIRIYKILFILEIFYVFIIIKQTLPATDANAVCGCKHAKKSNLNRVKSNSQFILTIYKVTFCIHKYHFSVMTTGRTQVYGFDVKKECFKMDLLLTELYKKITSNTFM